MAIAAKLDEYGKPAWLAIMVVGFIVFWPIGLAILAYMIWSGRMGCSRGDWGRWGEKRWRRYGRKGGWDARGNHSGNTAFEEYKAETLRRLEDEQSEFLDFLQRLREAKDKAEFDQFMAERKKRPDAPAGDGPEGAPA